MKQKGSVILQLIILVGVVVLVIGFAQMQLSKDRLGYGNIAWNNLGASLTVTTASVGVSTSTGAEIREDRNRRWLLICNWGSMLVRIYPYSSTTITAASVTSTASVIKGITLSTTTATYCYEFGPDNLYLGPLYLIADNTSTVQWIYK